jgi:xanthine dehydrogenase YagR molybdenum-binding subunit
VSAVGQPIDRVDGPKKVTGGACYAADFSARELAHALIITSRIARGRIARVEKEAAAGLPGVLAILTHANAPRLPREGRGGVNDDAGRETSLLQTDRVRYNGEPVALVIAESLEQAREAAARVHVIYEAEVPLLDFEAAKRELERPDESGRAPPDKDWGDVDGGFAQAEVRIEAVYSTPFEHHHPIEPHATLARWDGERLTLHDATQYVAGVRETIAKTFGMDPEKVRVVSPFVGGGFGSKGSVWSHVALAALAAKHVGRPVRLVLERVQMFGPVGGRPRTEQHLRLGAKADGTLVAVRHDVVSHTSRFEDFVEPCAQPTRALYACPNGATSHRLARMDVATPTFQRAPGESTGTFALESAMDELAHALGMDPLELRLRNHADTEPSSGKPWSSKRLRECYDVASRRFGWSKRDPRPRSMRDGHWRIGWGMATATYPGHLEAAKASATRLPDGSFVVRAGTHDLGTGTYTVMTQVAADALGLPVERVRFELGDTRLPRAPTSGGSMTVASVAPAVVAACRALLEKLASTPDSPQPPFSEVEAHGEAKPVTKDEESQAIACRSFGALFVEVRVDEALGIVRVPRVVGAYSVGRVLNPRTAASQIRGGVVMGIGMAVLEESVLDPWHGRIVNGNLAEYHVPVNADVGEIDVTFVEENDTLFNSVGARGVGEIGITGVAGAIANAVFHATGKRIRALPITLDKLL